MTSSATRRSDAFSDWLEARVAGTSTPDHEFDPDPELDDLRAAASRFHALSETWAGEPSVYSSPVTSWEDLMTTRAGVPASTSPISHQPDRFTKRPGIRDAVNRFVSVALIAAVVVAIGAGAWRLAGSGSFGDDADPSSTSVGGLVPTDDDAAIATLDEPPGSATTPVDQLPGIQGAVLRDYTLVDRPPAIADLAAISVLVFRFDSAGNARTSFDLIVSTFTAEFETTVSLNTGYAVVTNDVPGVGDRASSVRLDQADDRGYQVQEYVLTLDGTYVFAVMTVTGGPLTGDATPASIAEASAAAVDLARSLVANGQPSPDDARFYADGTSTGGDWGLMPPAGDPLLAGLLPQADQHLYPPEPGATAASATFPPDAQDLAGIVQAVYREYAPADMFVGSQSVSMAAATPMTEADLATERFNLIGVFVYQLETPKDAAVAYDRLSRGLLGSLTGFYQGDGHERLLSEDLPSLGDQAMRSHLTVTSTGDGWTSQTTFQYITVQRGEYVFVVSAQSGIGPVETLPDTAGRPDPMLDLATQLVTEGQPSPGEPVYVDDGTSTGGLWGFMPAAGDPLLMGLVPWMDQVMYPVP